MAGLFFVHKEIYEIDLNDEKSLYQFRGYNDVTDCYVFYDLAKDGDDRFCYFLSEFLEDQCDSISHKQDLYKFYE